MTVPVQSIFRLNHLSLWAREVEVWGNRVTATSLDRLLNLYLHHLGIKGSEDRRFFEEHVRPGMKVLDIGANQGLYTLLFSRIVGSEGRVFAFEPDPALFRSLNRNCEANRAANAELFNVGLGQTSGVMKLYKCHLNGGDNRLAKSKHPEWFEEVEVNVAPLDSMLGGTHIDFIKMDVQGWEYQVFKGMERIMRENRSVRIFFEYWPLGLTNAGSVPTDCLNYLRSQGFSFKQLSPRGLVPVTGFEELTKGLEGQQFANLFAVRES